MKAPGRHRKGTRPGRAQPRRFDAAKQAAAAQLDLMEPAWLVLYGPGCRRFAAIAAWQTPQPLRIEACTVEELQDLMRETELRLTVDPAGGGL